MALAAGLVGDPDGSGVGEEVVGAAGFCEFLRRAGADTAENVARESIGADLESRGFWLEAIDTLKEPIERLEELWSRQARPAGSD